MVNLTHKSPDAQVSLETPERQPGTELSRSMLDALGDGGGLESLSGLQSHYLAELCRKIFHSNSNNSSGDDNDAILSRAECYGHFGKSLLLFNEQQGYEDEGSVDGSYQDDQERASGYQLQAVTLSPADVLRAVKNLTSHLVSTAGVSGENESSTNGSTTHLDAAQEASSTSTGNTNYPKLVVLSVIIILTIIGNVSVVLSILMRRYIFHDLGLLPVA